MPFYLLELAGEFHRYYNKPANRIISDDQELSLARLYFARVLKDAYSGRTRVCWASARPTGCKDKALDAL